MLTDSDTHVGRFLFVGFGSMQTAVGLICVVLGCMHFVDRGRTPHVRSFYLGSVGTSHTLRAVLAAIEVTCGFALLFTA